MREQLIQYVELLFAAAPDSEEIKQEILQNTLDRYDDLVAQGKSPEAAYRLAITGIGDINEILGNPSQAGAAASQASQGPSRKADSPDNRKRTAVAVGMYILCPFVLILLAEAGSEILGLFLMFLMIAAATGLLILNGKSSDDSPTAHPAETSPRQELHKSVRGLIWAIGLAVYFILSFTTRAWYITWLVFPITGAVQGLARAIMDLKEANAHEN